MVVAVVVALGDVMFHLLSRRPSVVDGAFYVLAVAVVVLLRHRSVCAAFVVALALASFTGGGFVLLLWIAYQAGRGIVARAGFVVAVGAALGALGGQLATRPGAVSHVLTTFLVFLVLPMLAGRYVAQHERLVSTLEQNSRLRIARDMHDSLGHRLSLASIQAAALEVSDLPPQHRQAVAQLATSVRGAMDELYQMVAALRGSAGAPPPRIDAIDRLASDFHAAGVAVALQRAGKPRPLGTDAGEAAYRVAQEGLTNAAKHAPGNDVAVRMAWEPDALVLSITNPTPARPPGEAPGAVAGHGLAGLDERVQQAGGLLDHRVEQGEFRLVAMLPYARDTASRTRIMAVGVAAAVLMFGFLPMTMVVGVSP